MISSWLNLCDILRPGNQAPELSMEESDVSGAKESKTVKAKKVKVVSITFFNVRGIVHCEFLPQDQTINQQVYREILWRLLRDKSCGKPNSVCFTTTMHLLTMPWAYGSSWLRTFSCSTCWNNLPIHLTLLRVTFYFPKLKGVIKGTRFDNVETIKRSVTTEIRGILEESFQQCIEAWPTRMEKYIRLKGNYFEGETM